MTALVVTGDAGGWAASDRRSLLEQWDLEFPAALANEFRLGMEAVASGETSAGAGRFTSGEGRHGAF